VAEGATGADDDRATSKIWLVKKDGKGEWQAK
jgi:hypothetical protein